MLPRGLDVYYASPHPPYGIVYAPSQANDNKLLQLMYSVLQVYHVSCWISTVPSSPCSAWQVIVERK